MKNTQVTTIEHFCKCFCWITQRDAYRLGIYRLASRISDMKQMGYQILTEYVRVTNVDGTSSRIARYKIIKPPEEVLHDVKNVSV